MRTIRIPVPAGAALLAAALALGAAAAAAQDTATSAPSAAPADTPERMAELARIRREPGLKICRDSTDGKLVYSGFVQENERGNIKVQIAAATDKASGEPVKNFPSLNVWDQDRNWTICPK